MLVMLLLLLKAPADCYSQKYPIKGIVLSQKKLEPLAGASVVDSVSRRATTTNEKGEFTIDLTAFPGHILIDSRL